jgi:hypothetical protein
MELIIALYTSDFKRLKNLKIYQKSQAVTLDLIIDILRHTAIYLLTNNLFLKRVRDC